jgi:nucleoside-diphosphate-sugar epimerase
MKVLALGATGYTGRYVVQRLKRGGHDVAGLARNEANERTLADAGVRAVRGDVMKPETLVAPLADFDAVVMMVRVEIPFELAAVKVVLDTLEGSGKRFVFMSGSSVCSHLTYGDWTEANYAEDDPFPCLPGSELKVESENLTRAAASRGIHATVIRPPMIWGYGEQRGLASLHASSRTGAICYVGKGLNPLGSIHVDDLSEITLRTLERGVSGALYHAVSGEHSFRAMAGEVARLRDLPLRSLTFKEAEELFGNRIATNNFSLSNRTRCPRTRKDLDWEPHPDRLDVFAELGHPNFMAITGLTPELEKLKVQQAVYQG